MIKALAPGSARAGWRVVLALALGAALPLVVLAQGPGEKGKGAPKAKADSPGAEEPAAKGKEPEKGKATGPATIGREKEQVEQATVDPTMVAKRETIETYKDPRAEAALKNEFKELKQPRPILTESDRNAVGLMATGQANPDAAKIQLYVQTYAYELTRHRTIENLLDPAGDPREADRMARATAALIDPLDKANQNRAQRFREDYTRALVGALGPLLKSHLFTRMEAMVVLSKSGDKAALRLLADVLKDKDQVLAVKERAAVGLIQIAQRQALGPSEAIPAAQALSDFLQNDPDAFWPAKVRALEALGALRQVTSNAAQGQPDLATTALKSLADPKAKPDVRAWAGWALGMMQFSGLAGKYNFSLIGYHLGQAAVDIGGRIVAVDADKNYGRAHHYTALLLQLLEAFRGDPAVPGSGLLNLGHPGAASARPFLQQVEQNVRDIAKAAVELSRAPRDRTPPKDAAKAKNFRNPRAAFRAELAKQVNELKVFLGKNSPSDRSFVPGGPEFPGPAQVAAGGKPRP